MLITPGAREGAEVWGTTGWLTAWWPGHLVSGESPKWSRVSSKKVEGFPQAAETWQAPKYSDNKRRAATQELEWNVLSHQP